MDTSPIKTALVDVGMHHPGSVPTRRSALLGRKQLESLGTCSRAMMVAGILSSAIVSGRLGPGTKLVEQALADVFSVSRAVVRQAIIFLASEGLVSVEHNRGASVSAPTFQEALDICQTLIMIEQAVAAHLANHLQPSGWAILKRFVAQPPPIAVSAAERRAAMLDLDFRSMLVRLTRNTVTCAIHARLVRRTAVLLSFDEMELDSRDLARRRSRMVDQMERGRISQVAAMIERHHLSLLRNCFRERPGSRKMTLNEVSDCLAEMADGVSFSPQARPLSVPGLASSPLESA